MRAAGATSAWTAIAISRSTQPAQHRWNIVGRVIKVGLEALVEWPLATARLNINDNDSYLQESANPFPCLVPFTPMNPHGDTHEKHPDASSLAAVCEPGPGRRPPRPGAGLRPQFRHRAAGLHPRRPLLRGG